MGVEVGAELREYARSDVVHAHRFIIECGSDDGHEYEDDVVDVADAVLVLTTYAKKAVKQPNSLRYWQLIQGDVNGTLDDLTVEDAVTILTYYAKKASGQEATFAERQNSVP